MYLTYDKTFKAYRKAQFNPNFNLLRFTCSREGCKYRMFVSDEHVFCGTPADAVCSEADNDERDLQNLQMYKDGYSFASLTENFKNYIFFANTKYVELYVEKNFYNLKHVNFETLIPNFINNRKQ